MKQTSDLSQNDQNPVIISEHDYKVIMQLIGPLSGQESEMSLAHELKRAIVVNNEAFPTNTVGLNSIVTVMDVVTGVPKTFKLVTPSLANIKDGSISILSLMGAALLGFREGEEVLWKMPGGVKTFRITEVNNEARAGMPVGEAASAGA